MIGHGLGFLSRWMGEGGRGGGCSPPTTFWCYLWICPQMLAGKLENAWLNEELSFSIEHFHVNPQYNLLWLFVNAFLHDVVGSDISADGQQADRSESNNLLAAFLTFTSIVIKDTRCKYELTSTIINIAFVMRIFRPIGIKYLCCRFVFECLLKRSTTKKIWIAQVVFKTPFHQNIY